MVSSMLIRTSKCELFVIEKLFFFIYSKWYDVYWFGEMIDTLECIRKNRLTYLIALYPKPDYTIAMNPSLSRRLEQTT